LKQPKRKRKKNEKQTHELDLKKKGKIKSIVCVFFFALQVTMYDIVVRDVKRKRRST
jgi:hypothetical protein